MIEASQRDYASLLFEGAWSKTSAIEASPGCESVLFRCKFKCRFAFINRQAGYSFPLANIRVCARSIIRHQPDSFLTIASYWRSVMKNFIVITIILGAVAVCSAQTFRAGIQGTVTDPNGAVVSGAEVTITNPDTGLTRTTQTDDTGSYIASELPIGTYQVTVKKSGFHDLTVKDVKVEVSATTRVDVHLPIGSSVDVVDIIAQAPLVNAAENNLGGSIEAKQLQELPVSRRDF